MQVLYLLCILPGDLCRWYTYYVYCLVTCASVIPIMYIAWCIHFAQLNDIAATPVRDLHLLGGDDMLRHLYVTCTC